MSDTITLGKSRKDGKWQVLVEPERPFGEHLAAYQGIARKGHVSEQFTRIVIGKLVHSSPALKLISASEAEEKAKADTDRQKSVSEIVKSADARAQAQAKESSDLKALEHKEALEEKNAIVAKTIGGDAKQKNK